MKQIALFVIPYVLLVGHCDVWLISFPQFYHNSGVDPRQTPNSPFRSIRVCRSFPLRSDSSLSARNCTLMLFLCSFNCQLRCPRWKIKLARGHDSHVYVCHLSRILLRTAGASLLTSTFFRPLRYRWGHVLVLSRVRPCRRARGLHVKAILRHCRLFIVAGLCPQFMQIPDSISLTYPNQDGCEIGASQTESSILGHFSGCTVQEGFVPPRRVAGIQARARVLDQLKCGCCAL